MEPTPDREEEMPTAAQEMVRTPAYHLDEEGEDFVLRIPRSMVARDRIQRFVDEVALEHLATQDQINVGDVEGLAREVNRAVWQRLRPHLETAGEMDSAQPQGPAEMDDRLEQLYFMSKVERGLRQIDSGRFASHDEAKRRFGR